MKKKKIKKEDYKQFYNNISFNFDDPLKTIHYNAEGVINYKALLFLPTNQPMDLFNPDRKNKIKLYVQKVFITDDCEEIIPHWLRFIPGVVDSQDISLNISREMLQNNPIISKIKKGITIKILNELSALADVETKAYLNFWKNFGAVIKEGLYEFNDHHDKILPLLRFHTSENEEVISLDDYLLKMVKNQNEIYYFANTDKEHIKNSPQLETFIDKKIPVLFMTDAVDEFWLQNASKYKDKTFKSITKGKIDLSKIKSTNTKEKVDSEAKNNSNINDLINVLKKELENKISNVVVSNRLTKSPIILIADESGMDINMEKLMKMHNKTMPDSKKILEKVVKNIDFSDQNFPHMSFKEGSINKIKSRVMRISFTGELSYEINIQANYGQSVWEKCMDAGKEYGITPYGTEAMHLLRAEKGFIIAGQETDGTVTPIDLQMDWIVSKKKYDFIGKRSLYRSDTAREDRKHYVGLLTKDPNEILEEGAQIVAEVKNRPPMDMIGHITSSYYSPNLNKSIALAVVKNGKKLKGKKLFVPMANKIIEVTVSDPVFLDKEGTRLNA